MWLEVGCPFCSTVVTYPRAIEGQAVRCPECGKSYLVPVPNAATLAAAVASPRPVAPVAEPEPIAKSTASNVAVVAEPKFVAESKVAAPQLALHSPLAVLPILDPPQLRNGRFEGNSAPTVPSPPANVGRANSPSVAAQPVATPRGDRRTPLPASQPQPSQPQPFQSRAETTQTIVAPLPPQRSEAAAVDKEAQQRIRRAEVRALANMIIFVVGTLAMVGFAWFMMKLTGRS